MSGAVVTDTPVSWEPPPPGRTEVPVDISVVIPCLNEAGSIGRCVDKALEGIRRSGLVGEVVVCDNGSMTAPPKLPPRTAPGWSSDRSAATAAPISRDSSRPGAAIW